MSKKHSLVVLLLVLVIGLSFVSCSQPSKMDDKAKAMFLQADAVIIKIMHLGEETEGITKKDGKITLKDYSYLLEGKEYKITGFYVENESGVKFDLKFSPELPSGCKSYSADLNMNTPQYKMVVTINGKKYLIPTD